MRWRRSLITLVLLAEALTLASPAQEVRALAVPDSTESLVGDPIGVTVRIHHPSGTVFTPLFSDSLGPFFVLERRAPVPESDTTTRFGLTVAAYDSGSLVLPPILFSYESSGDSAIHTIETNRLAFSIELVEVDTTQPIKDLRPPLSIPLTIADIAIVAGIVLALAAVVFLGYRFWKERQEKKSGIVVAAPARPAHLLALEKLGNLKRKKLWQQGMIKEFYSELAEVLREYFEGRFGIMALEQTTEEILANLRRCVAASETTAGIEETLRRADLVKFARFIPPANEHEHSLDRAFAIVQGTKPEDAIPVATREPKVETYAGN